MPGGAWRRRASPAGWSFRKAPGIRTGTCGAPAPPIQQAVRRLGKYYGLPQGVFPEQPQLLRVAGVEGMRGNPFSGAVRSDRRLLIVLEVATGDALQ